MERTRIKICGLTRRQDAEAAVAAGADAIGVVLAPSKRRVSLDQAAAVLDGIPPLVARIGVFVDARADDVWEAAARLGLAAAQFHGDEAPETCAAAPVPVIKAFRVGPEFDPAVVDPYRESVAAVLLDTFVAGGTPGGTGESFDWHDIADRVPRGFSVMLAGGLTPANVGEAIGVLRPYAVDVSSGVEEAPGIKDVAAMHVFAAAVRAADEGREDV